MSSAGIEAFRAERRDVVVAVGGGSVLDMAKLINVLAHQEPRPRDVVARPRAASRGRGLPLVAMPTTSGSGSEATHFAVVYVGHVEIFGRTGPRCCRTSRSWIRR